MNILFDQTEAQASFFNGAAEYAQAVFARLVSVLPEYPDVNVFCLYSSGKTFRYGMLSPEYFQDLKQVKYVDYNGRSLRDIIREHGIDLLFITCAQAFCDLPLGNLKALGCTAVTVIHDLLDEEMDSSKIQLLKMLACPKSLCRHLLGRIHVRMKAGSMKSRNAVMQDLLEGNDAKIVTVSEYTKCTIRYNYPSLSNEVFVYAAPRKVVKEMATAPENETLKSLVDGREMYYLLLSADRPLKNAKSMMRAFSVFSQRVDTKAKLVTVGYGKKEFGNHIPLPFLSASDLELAYKNCHALLYPSLFEGFGYPPIEVMKYGKPVLSSNVCSMQEVLGSAPVYFSPIYESDMYRALNMFSEMFYDDLCSRSYKRYAEITSRQEKDLDELVNSILEGRFLKRQIQK